MDRFPTFLTIGVGGAIWMANILGRYETAVERNGEALAAIGARTFQEALDQHAFVVHCERILG